MYPSTAAARLARPPIKADPGNGSITARPNPQQLYVTSQRIAHAPLQGRAEAFRSAGGLMTPPGDDQWDNQQSQWRVELMEIHAQGDSRTHAISAWLYEAGRRLNAPAGTRATDGRPDCPYNGQGLAP
ncbi:hypothetical protein [Antarcticimicrobium luteum]|uniref:Uncharacterized protein n=1 Tax=Antarcticimicrobium luteum TaxID=2547397 RepID=A0A4R5VF68_9RHOB|nr:hypothetical protein [Antarcticimicrobium luteum]TDK51156.1 hypothetical protein E1832_04080 [Antarcticimicrobium luteum]